MEKKYQWNIGYWIVAGLLLLTLQNYWQAAQTIEPVPYRFREGAGRGARRRSIGVGPHGHRAAEIAGQPWQDDDRGHPRRTRPGRAAVEIRCVLRASGGKHLAA